MNIRLHRAAAAVTLSMAAAAIAVTYAVVIPSITASSPAALTLAPAPSRHLAAFTLQDERLIVLPNESCSDAAQLTGLDDASFGLVTVHLGDPVDGNPLAK
ncbi:hypothetical protein GCM10025867_48470 (plasmid) [Frondihabitans sucicola]|uniref:Uncharacterized protein n=1 Tax=Frondihabitans sucicola TaxID=1268041 RepID=A0ABM8GW15_9MICO|nr:hypothetical protein [Frondihabitans sucicola]BDZ52606.1 hypothetical protein GCM10025867_48470 [Frondihabitans sucicola]